MNHKAGFVSIVGKPNAGKSTLLNTIMGERVSIITPKAQTTRHRIKAIANGTDYQVIFSDTPGIIKAKYGLQKSMMSAVNESFEDADILLLVIDITEPFDDEETIERIKNSGIPLAVLLNKVDLSTPEIVQENIDLWNKTLNPLAVFAVSALKDFNIGGISRFILDNLPEHPAYFEKNDDLSDRNERFFISEMIREKIFFQYSQEIPYSTEVIIRTFKDEEKIIKILAEIIVERESQKIILIGKGGDKLKRVGTDARKDIEAFLGKQVYLELFVKVIADWRNKDNYLKQFGYSQ